MVQKWFVRSVVDVGCGKGVSASWFWTHGAPCSLIGAPGMAQQRQRHQHTTNYII